MDLLRWSLLLGSLALLTWLHVVVTKEPPQQRALPTGAASLHAIADQAVVARDSAGAFHLWSLSDLSFQRQVTGSLSGTLWAQQKLVVTTVAHNRFELLDLRTGQVKLQHSFGGNARIAGFDSTTNEVLVLHNKTQLRAYDATAPDNAQPTRVVGFASATPATVGPVSLHRGPGGAFALHQQESSTLWFYDSEGASQLMAISGFAKPPQFNWSEDGRALVVRRSNVSPFVTVTGGTSHQWRLPEYPRHVGVPQLQQVTSSLALFTTQGGIELRNTTSGAQLHSLQYNELQPLPPLDPQHGHPVYPCAAKLSNSARYLVLECNYKTRLTTSITDLQTMQTRQVAGRTGKYVARQRYINDSGLSLLTYGDTIDLVLPGQVMRQTLTNPALTTHPEPNTGWWIYRTVVLSMVLFLAIAMSRHPGEDQGPNYAAAFAQFQVLKTIAIFLVPLGLIFALFAYYVMGNQQSGFSIMSPGMALMLIGIFGLGAVATFTKLAVYIAGTVAVLTHRLQLQPANTTLVTAAVTCLALLFVPVVM